MGRGWMVGMASLSLPTIPVIVEEGGVGDSHPLFYVQWHERVYDTDDQGDDVWYHERRERIEQGSPGQYRLGPNLLQEFQGISTIPTPTDVRDAGNNPLFWKVEGDYVKLSLSCPWRFVNLNETFRPSSEFVPTRPLHVYCDVGTSSMVGGRITDLLREIKYHPQNTTHFEPRHIQYLPIRNEVVEIVETQMAEINGDLVQFGEGHTLLTLHFKREVPV